MRKLIVGLASAALVSVLVTPASANHCDPKLQGLCDRIHYTRCYADEVLTSLGRPNNLCTI